MRDDLGKVEHEHAKIIRCATSERSKNLLLGHFYKSVTSPRSKIPDDSYFLASDYHIPVIPQYEIFAKTGQKTRPGVARQREKSHFTPGSCSVAAVRFPIGQLGKELVQLQAANANKQFKKFIQPSSTLITMAKRKFAPSAPNQVLWFIALLVGILGILAHYVDLDMLSKYNYEMLLIGFVLLVVGTTYRGV